MLIFGATLSAAMASGSYPPNPPRLGGAALARIDANRYNLGKTLFLERLNLPSSAPAETNPDANRARLAATQNLLPERVSAQIDLPALAGRLSAEQVDALLYYIGIRFRIEVPAGAPSAS